MRRQGISGLGAAMVAAGVFLIFAGITDTPLLEGARNLARGRDPKTGAVPSRPSFGGGGASIGTGAREEAAREANR